MPDRLTLELADAMIDAGLAEARSKAFSPMCIAVLDSGGHVIALKREDGASLLRPEIAIAKAKGSLGMGCSSREIGKRAEGSPLFYTALFAISTGEVAPSAGGELVRAVDGTVLGAIGVSGDKPDADEICAFAGLAATGFSAEPAPPSA